MPLWQHQVEAVDFILRVKRGAIWGDTGIGKTGIGIELGDQLSANLTLVICPVLAVEMWKTQFEIRSRFRRNVVIVRSPDASLWGANVIVVPFSLISKYPALARRLRQYRFDLLIIDEAHALKTLDSNRTQAIYRISDERGGLQDCAPVTVLLSATLSPNGFPSELYPHLRALRPELLGPAIGYESFVTRYCEVKFGRGGREQIVGAKKTTAPELKRIMARVALRIRKRDVQDLPAVVTDTWPINVVDLVTPNEIRGELERIEALLARDIGRLTGEEALAIARASPHSATYRRLVGLLKLQAMSALLTAELEQGGKTIVFAYHTAVIEALAERFKAQGAVVIDGSTSAAKRIANVKAFRENAKTRLFIGQIAACSEVIDLSGCASMWFCRSDWTPKSIVQAVGRANRPGQVEPLTVRILTLSGSIDDAMARTLVRKTGDIETLEPV